MSKVVKYGVIGLIAGLMVSVVLAMFALPKGISCADPFPGTDMNKDYFGCMSELQRLINNPMSASNVVDFAFLFAPIGGVFIGLFYGRNKDVLRRFFLKNKIRLPIIVGVFIIWSVIFFAVYYLLM